MSDDIYVTMTEADDIHITFEECFSSGGKSGKILYNQPVIGVIDNVNTIFSTVTPFVSTKLSVLLNGINETFFTEIDNNSFQFEDPPLIGDTVRVDFTQT